MGSLFRGKIRQFFNELQPGIQLTTSTQRCVKVCSYGQSVAPTKVNPLRQSPYKRNNGRRFQSGQQEGPTSLVMRQKQHKLRTQTGYSSPLMVLIDQLNSPEEISAFIQEQLVGWGPYEINALLRRASKLYKISRSHEAYTIKQNRRKHKSRLRHRKPEQTNSRLPGGMLPQSILPQKPPVSMPWGSAWKTCRSDLTAFLDIMVLKRSDQFMTIHMLHFLEGIVRLKLGEQAQDAIVANLLKRNAFRQLQGLSLVKGALLAAPSAGRTPDLGEMLVSQVDAGMLENRQVAAQNAASFIDVYLDLYYAGAMSLAAVKQQFSQMITLLLPCLRYCGPASVYGIISGLVDLAGLMQLKGETRDMVEEPAYLGPTTPSSRNILVLAGVLRAWPEQVSRDLYYMLQAYDAVPQQRALSRLMHVAASLQLACPKMNQTSSHLHQRVQHLARGKPAMNGANLRLAVPSLSILAHHQAVFRPEALQLRRWVQGMEVDMSQEEFFQLYDVFLGDEGLYGEAAAQLSGLESEVLAMQMQMVVTKLNETNQRAAPLFDQAFNEKIAARLRDKLPIHTTLLMRHRNVYMPSVEYGLIVREQVQAHLEKYSVAQLVNLMVAVHAYLHGVGGGSSPVEVMQQIQQHLAMHKSKLTLHDCSILLTFLSKLDAKLPVHPPLLNHVLQHILNVLGKLQVSGASLPELPQQVADVLAKTVALQHVPISQVLRVQLLKLVQLMWPSMDRPLLAQSQAQVKSNLEFFMLTEEQWPKLLAGHVASSLMLGGQGVVWVAASGGVDTDSEEEEKVSDTEDGEVVVSSTGRDEEVPSYLARAMAEAEKNTAVGGRDGGGVDDVAGEGWQDGGQFQGQIDIMSADEFDSDEGYMDIFDGMPTLGDALVSGEQAETFYDQDDPLNRRDSTIKKEFEHHIYGLDPDKDSDLLWQLSKGMQDTKPAGREARGKKDNMLDANSHLLALGTSEQQELRWSVAADLADSDSSGGYYDSSRGAQKGTDGLMYAKQGGSDGSGKGGIEWGQGGKANLDAQELVSQAKQLGMSQEELSMYMGALNVSDLGDDVGGVMQDGDMGGGGGMIAGSAKFVSNKQRGKKSRVRSVKSKKMK